MIHSVFQRGLALQDYRTVSFPRMIYKCARIHVHHMQMTSKWLLGMILPMCMGALLIQDTNVSLSVSLAYLAELL